MPPRQPRPLRTLLTVSTRYEFHDVPAEPKRAVPETASAPVSFMPPLSELGKFRSARLLCRLACRGWKSRPPYTGGNGKARTSRLRFGNSRTMSMRNQGLEDGKQLEKCRTRKVFFRTEFYLKAAWLKVG